MILRTSNARIALVVLLGALLSVPAGAGRECVKVPPKQVIDGPDSELAFSGKVIEVTSVSEPAAEASRERPQVVRATFDVDRVWLGRVSKRFDIYMTYPSSAEAPRYDKDRSYVVIAKRLGDKQARAAAGVGDADPVVFTGVQCTDFYSVQEFILALGPGKPPTEKPLK